MSLRIGSVPYLNAKPLVDWFESAECDLPHELLYEVPSKLAHMLRADELDVANVSIFEGLRSPGLVAAPDISISAAGAVKSVRLFSKRPLNQVRSVALDASSLTSSALTRILLAEVFGNEPCFEDMPPSLLEMLGACDAGLIIGDLKLFELMPGVTAYDLGQGWKDLTGRPFVYAAWLAREDRVSADMLDALAAARAWGTARIDSLAAKWARRMDLPLDRCRDYLVNVMNYDLRADQLAGLELFRQKCLAHGLIEHDTPLRIASAG